ncbi:hypothetical protein AA313_de0210339 [Arthrobotrys entomopaga]|nr:hypothetical protein AA313_de0210339 [Arthrobotrys entomopaga]
MESATRSTTSARRLLNSLAKCVENYVPLNADKTTWRRAKQEGDRLFNPENGGSYEIFNTRPIPDKIISYSVGDVQCLPNLWNRFWPNSTSRWRDMVTEETKKRVAESQKLGHQPHGRHKALAPWSLEQNRILDSWHDPPPRRAYYDQDDDQDDYQDDD